jgi:hypothetical protein
MNTINRREIRHFLVVSKGGSFITACGIRKVWFATGCKRSVTCLRCKYTTRIKKP